MLPNRAPWISLFSSLADAVVAPNTEVILGGGFHDPETGLATEPMLTWTSDRQGPLGVGPEIATVLAEGPHRLTATGLDETGLTGSASVSIVAGDHAPPANRSLGDDGATRCVLFQSRPQGESPVRCGSPPEPDYLGLPSSVETRRRT
ncbi:MAG TPA: hypothetical protein VMN36_04400 [Verrucomicrobiales bacterium]|nr:hypothetical protein [Verrucomicrobiales bacterium]